MKLFKLTFSLMLMLSFFLNAHGQQIKKVSRIKPPVPIKVPPPPKPIPSPSEERNREADPLVEGWGLAFKSPKNYIKTDTAFIVQQKYFVPSVANGGRIITENMMYPVNFTLDSLKEKDGMVQLVRLMEVSHQDGHYKYDGKYPKQSTRIFFTPDAPGIQQKTAFRVIWKMKGKQIQSVSALEELETKMRWELSDAPAAAPMAPAGM